MLVLKIITFSLAMSIVLGLDNLTVITKSGPVKGVVVETPVGKTVKAFLGIPFAKPPIGNLRFKRPEPVTPWKSTFLASNKSKSCIQGLTDELPANQSKPWWIPDSKDTSEDCLTLNIWSPTNLTGKTAVIVYVYGGSFEGGTSASDRLDGQVLASEGDVVFASMNYRTNIFGFMYMDGDEAPGNMGLMDQALALRWIQNNIEAFGGDPERVTLMGLSAGGAAVNHHLTIPSSAGLFQRVIIQSGTSNNYWGYINRTSAKSISTDVATAAGCSNSAKNNLNGVKCLRNLDAETLVGIAVKVSQKSPLQIKWAPLLDGKYLPLNPEAAFAKKTVNPDIEVLLGTTSDEAIFYAMIENFINPYNDSFIDHDTFKNAIKFFLKTDNDLLLETVHYLYTDWEDPDNKVIIREQLKHFTTDYFYLCKTNSMSDLLVENGNQVFRYLFNHRPSNSGLPPWAGSIHGDDVDFVFGWVLNNTGGFTRGERRLSRKTINYLTNFAKYGNPNGKATGSFRAWPKYTTAKKDHLNLGTEIKVGDIKDLHLRECSFWNNLLSKIERSTSGCV